MDAAGVIGATNLKVELEKARREIHNLRKQLTTLQHIHQKEIDKITKTLDQFQCADCQRNVDPQPSTSKNLPLRSDLPSISFKPIGTIKSDFPRIRGTPRQPTIAMNNTTATLTFNKDVFTNPDHALQDLDQFSHLWIIFVFHENKEHAKAKVSPPRLNGVRTGVFASRSPHRPCPIGLSLVKIEKIVNSTIYFNGVDMIDGTPVLDIKPYIPLYDTPKGVVRSDIKDGEMEEEKMAFMPVQEILGTKVELLVENLELASASRDAHLRSEPMRTLERGDPDGEETLLEDNLQQQSGTAGANVVKVPSWIEESPVHRLAVIFSEEASRQLRELDPELADERSQIITNILQEDPRSVYLRKKWSGTFYIWRIVNLCVACRFNDTNHTVQITRIFQNEPQTDN